MQRGLLQNASELEQLAKSSIKVQQSQDQTDCLFTLSMLAWFSLMIEA